MKNFKNYVCISTNIAADLNDDQSTTNSLSISKAASLAEQIKYRQQMKQSSTLKSNETNLARSQLSNKSGLTQSVTFKEPAAEAYVKKSDSNNANDLTKS